MFLFKTPVEIWAYGSRIKGTSSEASDLDLVVLNKSKDKEIRSSLKIFKENLKQSNIPIFVQVTDWDLLPNNYKEEIEKKHHFFFHS